ncbi:molybdopterin molybdotransferase MoeA [Pirellulales bacterium]|nr:molybdopterin molybdotransferase MoeA [Pirellulales bacterium]
MISIEEALALVRQHTFALEPQATPLDSALGLQLAEPVTSDVDSPPFDKSLVDGYAVDAADQTIERTVIEEVFAGAVPVKKVERGTAIRVMTGAPLPTGATAVAKIEDCRLDGDQVTLPKQPLEAGVAVLRRGASYRAGESVLQPGKRLAPLDIALLAEIGRASVSTVPRPRVAVLATGDELVAYHQRPAEGQIRNSNGPMIASLLHSAGFEVIDLGIGRDDRDDLRQRIDEGLQNDVLLLTGGVSAGVKDLVPGVLAELNVQQVFHKIRMKPGKPVWFGVWDDRQENRDRRALVYGLPGNPVSALVAYLLLTTPALRLLSGDDFEPPPTHPGVLAAVATHRGGRPTYHPAKIHRPDGDETTPQIELLPWRGSADLRAVTAADGFALLPPGDYVLPAGETVSFVDLAGF